MATLRQRARELFDKLVPKTRSMGDKAAAVVVAAKLVADQTGDAGSAVYCSEDRRAKEILDKELLLETGRQATLNAMRTILDVPGAAEVLMKFMNDEQRALPASPDAGCRIIAAWRAEVGQKDEVVRAICHRRPVVVASPPAAIRDSRAAICHRRAPGIDC